MLLDEEAEKALAALSDRGLRRTLRTIDGAQQPRLIVDGRPVLNFCSNNYLGLADSPLLIEAATEAMALYGFGSGGSRLITGNLAPHRQLERRLAEWKRSEAALLFNSGYQANVGVLSALVAADDLVFSDALNHASLIDGCRLTRARVVVYPHRDLDALAAKLRAAPAGVRRYIVSETLFSMDGDRADAAALLALAREHGAALILDEAHGAGIEDDGAGADLRIGTFGKALGGFGAYVVAKRAIVELLLNRARSFVFTTALPVPVVAAATRAIDFVASAAGQERIAQLRAHSARVARHLCRAPTEASHIVPLLLRDGTPEAACRASAELLCRGLFVQAIRPPTVPTGQARLRLSLMATHTTAELDLLLGALDDLRDRFAS